MICRLLTVMLLATPALAEMPAAIEFQPVAGSTRVSVVARLPEAVAQTLEDGEVERGVGGRYLQVALVDAETARLGPPMLGGYRRQGAELQFTPRFAWVRGGLYRATLKLPGQPATVAEYRVPEADKTTGPVVTAIYPTAARLPANLLKFYLHFSQPMRESEAIFEQIELRDSAGKALSGPWRRTQLWSDGGRRLTLYIHPGRIKTGVNLRVQLGPVLEPDRQYTLLVRGLKDAEGRELGQASEKRFTTIAADRTRPDASQWKIKPPPPETRQPLVVRSPEPLDRHLLARCLQVIDHEGLIVPGTVAVADQERTWQFRPREAWRSGSYTLVVDPILEDLAGNSPERVFDTDLEEEPVKKLTLRRKFLVGVEG